MYRYVLSPARDTAIAYIEYDRPELLHCLRLGLPDCVVQAIDKDQYIEFRHTPLTDLIQARLSALIRLDRLVEIIRCQTMCVSSTSYPGYAIIPCTKQWQQFAQWHEVDLDLFNKEQQLLQKQAADMEIKCRIFFDSYSRRISVAESLTEIQCITERMHTESERSGFNT